MTPTQPPAWASSVLERPPGTGAMKKDLHFAVVSKVSHPWFDQVYKGAAAQAHLLKCQLGIDIEAELFAPTAANVTEQNSSLKAAAAGRPDGIAIDPVAALSDLPEIRTIRSQGIPLILFDSPSPESGITSVGNDFIQQGMIAANRLVQLIGHAGKVAVMKGVPTAPNHSERYQAQIDVLNKYRDIVIVDGGIDYDSIETARREAGAVLASNPDLRGYLCCDASGPIGIAKAIMEAKKVGEVKVVGMDGIKPILEAIRDGIVESSSSTIPRMQGSMVILMLWQASLGVQIPQRIDTGIDLITRENVDRFLALSRGDEAARG